MSFIASFLLLSLVSRESSAHPQGFPGQPGQPSGPPSGPSGSGPGYGEGSVQSPAYPWLFQYPLPIPEVAQPAYEETVAGTTIQYFDLTVTPFEFQAYPNLGPASLVGYNGNAPGPTFRLQQGVQSIVRIANNDTGPSTFHLHGSSTHATWDGWASDLIQPGQFKDYYYPNDAAATLWYHDHVEAETAPHTYYGQHGVYIISDPEEDALGLPSGDYDIPLAILDKAYQSDGSLVSPADAAFNFFGDVVHVNGQPWPYLNVEPRKYRLRLYDMSLSRPYDLSFVDDNNSTIQVQVIASGGLFGSPITTGDVVISMGERYDVVIDFSPYSGTNVTLMNLWPGGLIPQYENTDLVMRFVVGQTVSDDSNNGTVPSQLATVNWPPVTSTIDHVFNFVHGGDDDWTINGKAFNDINNRVLAKMPQGSVQQWQLNYASGPGVHPVHLHLVQMQIISRSGGSRGVLPYEAAGLKDVVLLEPGESVTVRAFYGPLSGLYLFHCHNLVHEDNMMMDVFNVTQLAALGYDFSDINAFDDPTDPTYAAQDIIAAVFEPAAIQSTISALGNSGAYASVAQLSASEAAYYKTAGYPSPSAAPSPAYPPYGGAPGGPPSARLVRALPTPTTTPL